MVVDIKDVTVNEIEYLRQQTGRYNDTPGELILWILSDWILNRRRGDHGSHTGRA
jgi:hypothetical protein